MRSRRMIFWKVSCKLHRSGLRLLKLALDLERELSEYFILPYELLCAVTYVAVSFSHC